MDAQTRDLILNQVDESRDQIVAYLQDLVRFDSVTGNEARIQTFVSRTLVDLGLEVDQFDIDPEVLKIYPGYLEPEGSLEGRPNVVGVWRGSGGGKSLLLNGHVDTVPLEPLEEWHDGALEAVVQDGRLYGRGSSDMKGGVAAMTMAVSVLKALDLHPKGDVILEYVVDEERTGLGTLMCVHKGYRADAGICCETSDLQVMPACIGRMWFTVHLRTKPAGISARWEGVSAIDKGWKIVQAVYELEKMRVQELHHPLFPDNRGALPCAVTMFNAGTFPSITPERAVLRGSLGLMPYEVPGEVEAQLRAQILRVAEADAWMRNHPPVVTTEGGYVASGAEIPTDHPIVNSVRECFEHSTGEAAVIGARMGAADTRFLIHAGETPTVIFGPGVTSEMHAMNENIPVENLITATKVIALAIHDWCNQEG